MEHAIPNKTLKNGFSIPVFGMGTWMMGGGSTRDPENDDQRDIDGLRYGLGKGLTHIDTAEMYAAGHAEEMVAEAIANYHRDHLFITSKVWYTNLRYDDVLKAAENSLKRLGTDYLDLYLIHKPNEAIPMEETFKALDKLQDQNLIRHVGVSNFSTERLKQAQTMSYHPIVANQVQYNLTIREPEASGLLEYCQRNDVIVMAWRPIEKGVITESPCPVLKSLMEKYNKTAAQIALNWLISQPNVVTMSTMRSPNHIDDNIDSVSWTMESEDVELLRTEFPDQQTVSAVPLA